MLLGWDSAAPATLWDAAVSSVEQPLQVRVVYLDRFSGGRAEVGLSHARGATVVLCANSTTASLVARDLECGVRYGEAQAHLAEALGAPRGVGIAVDVEAGWEPRPEWIAGWVYGVLAAGYRPLVYGSLRAAATASALLVSRSMYATVARHLAVWSATPVVGWRGEVPRWVADQVGNIPTVGWQFAEDVPIDDGAMIDLDLWDERYLGLWRPPASSDANAARHDPDITVAVSALRSAQTAIDRAVHALQP